MVASHIADVLSSHLGVHDRDVLLTLSVLIENSRHYLGDKTSAKALVVEIAKVDVAELFCDQLKLGLR
jgi:hypothetical protein